MYVHDTAYDSIMNGSTTGIRLLALPRVALGLWLIALLAVGGGGGCSSSSRPAVAADEAGWSRAECRGDWDDVGPSVEAAVGRIEAAVEDSRLAPDGTRTYALRTLGAEPGLLEARPGPEGVIELRTRVGRFGDPVRERRLLDAVVRRLAQLRGVDAAPLPAGW